MLYILILPSGNRVGRLGVALTRESFRALRTLFVPGNDGVASCLDQRKPTGGKARDVSEGEFSVSTPGTFYYSSNLYYFHGLGFEI